MAPRQRRDIEEIAGEGIEVKVGEEIWKLAPLRIRDLAAAKARIRGNRRASYQEYVDSMPEGEQPSREEQQLEHDEIRRQFISDLEVGQWWISELEGMLWLIHRSLSKENPDVTMEEVEGKLSDVKAMVDLSTQIATQSGFEIEKPDEKKGPTQSSSPGNSTSQD